MSPSSTAASSGCSASVGSSAARDARRRRRSRPARTEAARTTSCRRCRRRRCGARPARRRSRPGRSVIASRVGPGRHEGSRSVMSAPSRWASASMTTEVVTEQPLDECQARPAPRSPMARAPSIGRNISSSAVVTNMTRSVAVWARLSSAAAAPGGSRSSTAIAVGTRIGRHCGAAGSAKSRRPEASSAAANAITVCRAMVPRNSSRAANCSWSGNAAMRAACGVSLIDPQSGRYGACRAQRPNRSPASSSSPSSSGTAYARSRGLSSASASASSSRKSRDSRRSRLIG